MKPAQNAPLTRSPRGNDGDDGDGADSSAWLEDKKQDGAMSSEATRDSGSESVQILTHRSATMRGSERMNAITLPVEEIFTANDVSD